MSPSRIAPLLFLQATCVPLSSTPAQTATAFLRTTSVTSLTTAGTTQTRTLTSAVRPFLVSDQWLLMMKDWKARIDFFFYCYLSEGFHGRCSFEFDLCSWRQSQADDFDWLIKAGSTPTVGTGPSNDHTLRDPSGHYLYLESSFPQVFGDTARIVGPLLSSRSSHCKVRISAGSAGGWKRVEHAGFYSIPRFFKIGMHISMHAL